MNIKRYAVTFDTQTEAEAFSGQLASAYFGNKYSTQLLYGWKLIGGKYLLFVPQETPGAVEYVA